MVYDQRLAERVQKLWGRARGVTAKRMFGGMGFLLHGNMCLGVWQQCLIARIGPDAYEAALTEPYVVEFDITGRPMRGWVMVEPDGLATEEHLQSWLERARAFVATLPPK